LNFTKEGVCRKPDFCTKRLGRFLHAKAAFIFKRNTKLGGSILQKSLLSKMKKVPTLSSFKGKAKLEGYTAKPSVKVQPPIRKALDEIKSATN